MGLSGEIQCQTFMDIHWHYSSNSIIYIDWIVRTYFSSTTTKMTKNNGLKVSYSMI